MTEANHLAPGDDPAKYMKDLVREIACALVDNPESVSVEAFEDRGETVLRLREVRLGPWRRWGISMIDSFC